MLLGLLQGLLWDVMSWDVDGASSWINKGGGVDGYSTRITIGYYGRDVV